MDLNLWNIIESDFQKSFTSMNKWNDLEKKTFSLNVRAINALFCTLDDTKFNRFSIYEMTFDILAHS